MAYVQVAEEEGGEVIELPAEDDGTLLMSTLIAQFPGACGLKYRSETGTFRGVRSVEDRLQPPDEGWDIVFICSYPKENKRKNDESIDGSITKRRMENRKCVDLIVLGLPWKTSEEELKSYFEQYGQLLMAQVKKDPQSGKSKGYGFIRYGDYESQCRVLLQRHRIDGRYCDVKIPNSKEGSVPYLNSKVFVGRTTEEISREDLREYFEKFGEVTDVFIPKPFRAFAFVTFLDPEVASSVCGQDHIIKGASLHVSDAAPKQDRHHQGQKGAGGPYKGGYGSSKGGYSNGSSYGGGGWNMTPNQMPPNNNWNSGGWGGNSGGSDWNRGSGFNMEQLAMPVLAALSQASMGFLQQQQQQQQQQQHHQQQRHH